MDMGGSQRVRYSAEEEKMKYALAMVSWNV